MLPGASDTTGVSVEGMLEVSFFSLVGRSVVVSVVLVLVLVFGVVSGMAFSVSVESGINCQQSEVDGIYASVSGKSGRTLSTKLVEALNRMILYQHLQPVLPASYGSPFEVSPTCPEVGSFPDSVGLVVLSPKIARLAAVAAFVRVSMRVGVIGLVSL